MKKRILSILLCFCMVLSLLPMPVQAATHTLTVIGGKEGTDYKWGGSIYKMNGESSNVTNVLVILTDKELTITGDNTGALEYRDVISINKGVTANLTLNGVKISSSDVSAGITIAPGGALNLTLQGTNTFQQERGVQGMSYNYPAIRVPGDASLTVTDDSTGSLTSSTFGGSAVIGGFRQENCGTVTINGGTFDLTATGSNSADFFGGPAMGPGRYASNGTITINGGCIKAYSQWGAGIGSGYFVYGGFTIGAQNETITINGGTVVATTEQATTDGIGGFGGKAISGGVTINGGSVNTSVRNTRPKYSNQNLYKTTLVLSGAGANASVSKVSALLNAGLSESYNTADMKTDADGKIYVWLPENAIVNAVTAGSETYTGMVQTTADDSASGTLTKDTAGYTLTTGAAEHATLTYSKKTGLKAGDTVVLHIAPEAGYELTGLSLYEGDSPDVPFNTSGFTKISSNLWSFTMPEGNRKLYVNMSTITDTGDFAVSHASGCSYAYDSTAKTLTFSGTGSAMVSMKKGVISTSERIVFGNGAAVKLTISSLNITSAKGIDVSDTAGNCELILEGSNQISALDSDDAGLHKGNGTGTLTFTGSGSLNVTMNRHSESPYGSAIGGNKGETVQGLIFNGGAITATSMTNGAGIGVNGKGGTTSLAINGGIIRGIGGSSSNGIGTGYGKADQITITGGTVYGESKVSYYYGGICSKSSTVRITGGSVNMVNSQNTSPTVYFAQPVNASNAILYLTTITVGSGENLSKNALVTNLTFSNSYTYGIHDMYTDGDGKLYLWLPLNTVVTGVATENGIYNGTCTTNATEQNNHYLKGTAEATFTLSGSYFIPVTDIELDSAPGLGETDLNSITTVKPANATNSNITWTITEAGSTGASISDSKLTLLNAGTYKLQATIKNGVSSNTDFVKTFTLTVKQLSYMITEASKSVTYGDTLSIPVSFAVSGASDAVTDTGVSGTVKLSTSSDGSNPIATATILGGKGMLVYQTSGKELLIGDNTLYVVYDGSDTRMSASQTIVVTVAKRVLTVSVEFALKTYDGNTNVNIKSAALSGNLFSDTVTLGDYSSITASAASVVVGAQNVTLNGNFTIIGTDAGRYELTQPIGLTIEITKASGTASVTMEGWTYRSSANDPAPMSATNGTTNVTYQYKVKNALDSTYTPTKPTTAGDYTVQAIFQETDYYAEINATADFTIAKAAASLSVEPVSTKVYGEQDFKLSVTKIGESDVTYSSNNTSVVKVDASGNVSIIGVGNATITVSMPESANYEAATNAIVNILVSQASFASATVSLDKTNFTYNGKSQIPTVTVKMGEKALVENTDYTVSYSNSNGNENDTTNVGAITVMVTAKDGSYLGTADIKPTYTIDKATLIPSIAGTTSKAYDGNTAVGSGLSISLSGIQNSEPVSATADFAYDDKNVDTEKTITASNITLVGDNGNYILAGVTATADAGTITAKKVDVTISGDSNYTYDGNANYAHTATYTTIGSDTPNVTIKYDGSTTRPVNVKINGSNVEAYALTAVINDKNYELKDTTGTTSFTISPAIITATGASKTLLYTNTATQTANASDFGINIDGIFKADGVVSDSGNIINSVEYGENVTYALKSGLSYSSQTATIPLVFTPADTNYAPVKVNLAVSLADKGSGTVPEAFTLQFKLNADGATYTATIPAVVGAEYSFNGTAWSDINTKTDVAPGTSVTGYIRMKETDDKKASDAKTDTQTAPLLVAKMPVASPDGGIFSGSQTVSLTCGTEGADIYYTTDGSTPTTSSNKYIAAFKVSDTTTVKALAVKTGMINSEVMTVIFTKEGAIVSLNTTNFTYNGKSQVPTVTVKLGDTTLTEGTDYTVSYSNSNGKGNDTTNVGTITVTATAKAGSYFGEFSSQSIYTIDKATLTPSILGTTSKEYDGGITVGNESGLSISLSGIQNSEIVSAIADYNYNDKNVGDEKTITASNIKLSGDNGNYALASKTATANVGTITAKPVDVTISGDSNYIYDGNSNYAHTATYTAIGSDMSNVTIKYDVKTTRPVDVKINGSNVEAYALTAVINDKNYELKDTSGTKSFKILPAIISASGASKTLLYTNTTTQTAIYANFGINMEGVFSPNGEMSDKGNIIESVGYGENVTYALKSGLSYSAQSATIPLIFTPNSKNYAIINVNLTVNLANKDSMTTPSAFTLNFELNADGATYTATIPYVEGAEYSFDGANWSDINTKSNVIPGESITGYIRMKETGDKNASDVVMSTQTAPLLIVIKPKASPGGGNFTNSQIVTLTCVTDGADIYYTTDGSTPTDISTKYTEAFILSDTATVKAVAIKAGMKNSEVMTAVFTKNTSDGNNDGGNTDSKTPTTDTKVTVTVKSEENSVKADVTIKDNTAIVEITDKQIEEIASGKTNTGKIKLDVSDIKVDTVVVPTELVSAAYNDTSFKGLEIVLPTGTVTLDKTALNSIGSKGNVKISVDTVSDSALTDIQKAVLGTQISSAVIVDVNVYVGDNNTNIISNGKIEISVPYTLKPHEKAEDITVWLLQEDGTIEPKNGVYDDSVGCVNFASDHLSQFMIVNFPFTDVAESEWYYESIAYAYNNRLFSGTSETTFSPDEAMTREMIWMVLARMDGKAPADMKEARAWAIENGISDGTNPTSSVTREQMAAILYRYAAYKKYDTTEGGMAIREFADYDTISEYALPAMSWSINTGLVQGSNNYVMSSGSATRAQVAAILMRFSKNISK